MLNFISIRNFALIESCELEFSPKFNVFTGESGAGKSILMGAVDLLLGGRADRSSIRSGCQKAEVSGIFTVPEYLKNEIAAKLGDADISFDPDSPELCLRRVVTPSSTRNYLNDSPVSAKLISELGAVLMDRHGAGEQLSLLLPSRQLELLDRFGALTALRKSCADICSKIAELEKQRIAFEANLPDESEADRLALMVEEIERVNPVPGEDDELAARHKLASNSCQILSESSALAARLSDSEDSIADQIGSVCRKLSDLARIEENQFDPLVSACMQIQEDVCELSRNIQNLAGRIELDPGEFAALEERLSELHTLKRRYAPTIDMLLDKLKSAKNTIDDFKRSAAKRQEFANQKSILIQQLADACRKLSAERKNAALSLTKQLVERLKEIGFSNAVLQPDFSTVPDSANGADHFEFLFSANLGEDLRPLRKIASSGELSRIMLAFKIVLADSDSIPTVVFDEIDMNIGGETANKVGAALKLLGEKRQILSISHLAQVASCADQHFLVQKSTADGRTFSTVQLLDDPSSELSRMLGLLFLRKKSKTKKLE